MQSRCDAAQAGDGARGADSSEESSAAAAATASVALLVQMKHMAHHAVYGQQHAQALELRELALAVAESVALPADSLVLASLRAAVADGRTALPASAGDADTPAYRAAQRAAWVRDVDALALARTALDALQRRAASDTLSTSTPTEVAYFDDDDLPADMRGAALLVSVAEGAATLWPPAATPEHDAARLDGIHAALRAALALEARGSMARSPRTGQRWAHMQPDMAALRTSAHALVSALALDAPAAPPGALRAAMRARGLSAEDEEALRAFAARHAPVFKPVGHTGLLHASQAALLANPEAIREAFGHMFEGHHGVPPASRNSAAAPPARAPPQPSGGAHACALPSCGQLEPAPKAFKLCGRCRRVAYCCREHQAQHWRRHKAAGCSPAAT